MTTPTPSIEQLMQGANDHQRAGRLLEAEQLLRQALAINPREPQALNGLGTLALHLNRLEDAANLFNEAVSVNPSEVGFRMNLGTALLKMGRVRDAAQVYHQVVTIKPDFAEAYTNLGVALAELGQMEEAASAHRKAIILKPQFSTSYQNLGSVLRELKRYEEAIEVLKQGLTLDPGRSEMYARLGMVYMAMGPDTPARYEDAIGVFRRGLTVDPSHPYLMTNLGVALSRLGRLDEAVMHHRRSLEINPGNPATLLNLGVALHNLGRFDEAKQAYLHGLAVAPDDIALHSALAFVLMTLGEWDEGFREYERRFEYGKLYQRAWPKPRWDGSDPAGKTILLAAEQGIGDTIHFVRYARMLQDRGATVILEAQESLVSLLGRTPGVGDVVAQYAPLPAHDFYAPLPSLPHHFKTRPDSIPAPIPYVFADDKRVRDWKDRLAGHGPGLKVGLVWAGSPKNRNDVYRSVLLADFAPLAEVKGVKFFSLQKGPQASQTLSAPPGLDLTELGGSLESFEDTAALLANLDLLVAVDTAAVHLAGAMGRPVWTLVSYSPDWRWLLNRSDTPWYPSMRLFRQPSVGGWASAIRNVRAELAKLAG